MVWVVMFTGFTALWLAAILFGFIGSGAFIGHVSMAALLITAGAGIEASLPSVGDNVDDSPDS